jgi:signal transduction histidine kinase
MTTLRGTVQLGLRRLERDQLIDEKRLHQYLRTINEQSAKLVRLTEQLLDVSRIESGQLALDREVLDVVPLVRVAVAAAQDRTSHHHFTLHAPEPPALVWGDPLRLEQVLTNLLDNAIKYSPDGGAIEVDVRCTASSAAVTRAVQIGVRDHGLGVPPEHLPRIFDRLYQGHTMSYTPGMGLGLYVARQIAELHGGRIDFERPRDSGSRFVVTLPLSDSPSPPPAA